MDQDDIFLSRCESFYHSDITVIEFNLDFGKVKHSFISAFFFPIQSKIFIRGIFNIVLFITDKEINFDFIF